MSTLSERMSHVIAVADAQHGLITAAQLEELGVHSGTVSRRSLGGMWTRVLPGVHLVDGGEPDRRQRERAALLYAGPTACLTGTTALPHHGVAPRCAPEGHEHDPSRPEPVHVLIPHERRCASRGYARVERTRRFPADVESRQGLVLAPLDRAVADAARRMRRGSDVVALVTGVVQRGLVPVPALRRELEEGSRRGSAYLRAAVVAVESGARSLPEEDVRRLLLTLDVPHTWLNVVVVREGGSYVGFPDVWLDDAAVALEVDSVEHHSGDGYRRTVRRNARYAAAGVAVVSILPTDLRDRPGEVGQTILEARRAALERGRPAVRMATEPERSAGLASWRWGG